MTVFMDLRLAYCFVRGLGFMPLKSLLTFLYSVNMPSKVALVTGVFIIELVHVIQWERLGVDDFLLAYGAGLMQFGYRDSPLEKMAYSLQASFDGGVLPANTIELIQQGTDAIWNGVASLISKV